MIIDYRKATASDAEEIERLATEIWNEHYISIISQEQIDYMLDLMYSKQSIIKQMEEGCEFTLAFVNNTLEGYISIEESKKEAGEFFLHKFYVRKDARGTGLGENMFNYVFGYKPQKKLVRLFVNRENFKSINFYFKMGFVIERVINQNIGKGFYMNDFIMIKKF